jgi:hypothetical protein
MVMGEGENPPPVFFHIIAPRPASHIHNFFLHGVGMEEKNNTRLGQGEQGSNKAIRISHVRIPEPAVLAIARYRLDTFVDEGKAGMPALEHRTTTSPKLIACRVPTPIKPLSPPPPLSTHTFEEPAFVHLAILECRGLEYGEENVSLPSSHRRESRNKGHGTPSRGLAGPRCRARHSERAAPKNDSQAPRRQPIGHQNEVVRPTTTSIAMTPG